MKLDKFSQPVFQSQDLFDLIYENGPEILEETIIETDTDIASFIEHSDLVLKIAENISYSSSIADFDKDLQKQWFMPDEYKSMDIEGFLVDRCPKQNYQRLIDELNEFKSRNMLDLLCWLKYFVDVCKKNDIVWGVGRGSSVASYVLFLIGVHKIDSIKYNLDWREFLR